MVAVTSAPPPRPEARVFRIEELLVQARAGRIRVPSFQRGFKWDREDVRKLLDSIWRGYPIGTLLLWSKLGPAGRVLLGDLTFEVSEQSNAWYVVDGQQRIVSLVSTLLLRGPRAEGFDFYFDLVKGEVVHARRGGVPATQLPLDRVVDSEDLLAWADENRADLTPEQVRFAFRVGKVLREYEIPAYVVTVDDETVVREIFERTNSTGKRLEVTDVFNALHTPLDRQPAVSLKDVVERLRVRSLGDIDEDQVLRSLLAIQEKSLSGDLQRQLDGVDIPTAIARVEKAMDRVFGFLAQDASIPHLRLLPYQSPLTVLSAFFDRFSTPSTRARRLLTRWLWRGSATGELRGSGKGMRPALEAVRAATTAERAARGVLSTVSTEMPELEPEERFNLRFARSRLAAIVLVELRPHELRTGELLDTPALLNSNADSFPQIITSKPASLSSGGAAIFFSAANRLLHPDLGAAAFLSIISARTTAPHVLASHGVSAKAADALRGGDQVTFLEERLAKLNHETTRLINRHAEWEHSDRESLAALSDEED